MANGSKIEWTEATWNPVAGCTPVSPGCLNCYAATMANRLEAMGQEKYKGLTVLNNGRRVFNGKITLDEDALTIPFRWKKPRRIFVNSMSDLFHEEVPFSFVDKVFGVMALCQQHTFQVLTKRVERMAEYMATRTAIGDTPQIEKTPQWYQQVTEWLDGSYGGGRFFQSEREWDRAHAAIETVDVMATLKNVHLGTSVENQKAADERVQHLVKCPGTKFLSMEPLLGAVDLHDAFYRPRLGPQDTYKRRLSIGIDWIIVGGESGPNARPMHPDWARSIRDQCQAAGVPFFFKQWGHWAPFTDNVDRHYRDGRPAIGDTNRQYVRAINKMIRSHGGTKLLDDRPEGWEQYMVDQGTCIGGGSDNQLFLLNVGKKAAGRLLDGRTHDAFPEVSRGQA